MLTVQASGIDVFGIIGRWTEEIFHFDIFSSEETQTRSEQNFENVAAFQKAATVCDIPQSMIPTWSPKGFEPSEPKTILIEGYYKSVCCLYYNNQDGRTYSVDIRRYYRADDIQVTSFEKDSSDV